MFGFIKKIFLTGLTVLSKLVCLTTLRDKSVEKCTETVENEDKCSSCILSVVLFSIFFTTNVAIANYFVYYKCINLNKENTTKYDYVNQPANYLI